MDTIPREFYVEEVSTGVLSMMASDLGTSLPLNDIEPTYYGHPEYVVNYPCLVSVPNDAIVESVESPLISEQHITHRIVYIFEAKRKAQPGFTDPYVLCARYGQKLLDWLAYASVTPRLPLITGTEDVDTNWAAHFYMRPWYLRIDNEYSSQLKELDSSKYLFAPLVEFTTVARWPFMQLTA